MRRIFVVLTIAMLVVTGLLAWGKIHERSALRDAAESALPAAQNALEEAFAAAVADAGTALRAWETGAVLPAGLSTAEVVRSAGPSAAVPFDAARARVRLTRAGVEVVVPGTDDRSFRRGLLDPAALVARIEADPRLGAPASRDAGRTGRYSRIEIVGGATGDVAFVHAAAKKRDDDKQSGGAPGVQAMLGGGSGTLAHKQIQRGNAGSTTYKGAREHEVLGAWREVDGLPGVWALVEIRDADVVFPAGGFPLSALGQEFAQVHLWHGTLGLTMLLLLVTVFLSLQKRGVQYGVLARVFTFVGPYKWGALSVIGLGLAYTALNQAAKVLLIRKLVDDVLVKQGEDAVQTLWVLAGIIVVVSFLVAGTGYLKQYLHNFYATAIMADIRLAIGRKIVSLPMSFFQRFRAGDLVARIERDAASMRKVFNQAFNTASVEPFELVGMVVLAFMLNARMALVLIGLPLMILPIFRIARRIRKRAEKRQVLLADISHVIFQMLVGIKVIKAFGGQDREAMRLDAANRRFVGEARRVHRLSALSESLMDLLQMLGAAIIFVAGGYLVLNGGVTVGDVTAFLIIIQRVYTASKKLTSTANAIVNAMPGTERVFEVLDAENTLPDGPQEMLRGPLKDGIRFDHVSFAYGEKHVLKDIDLHIPAGKVVAVVGPTGAGKTTLCDLVARFYDPTAGAVRYDGVDIRDCTLQSVLSNVAIVTQDAFLFNATIEENIRYGNPDATREDMLRAAADAFVHDEIKSMEGAYQKVAGERGTSVSGGQRQRITIARAILKDAPVLILDEATSALDTHAEKKVQAALDKLMAGRTVIVVAHRLSTIRNADVIVVMKAGEIVETGTPTKLLNDPNSQFKTMYELQMGRQRDVRDAESEDDAAGEEDAA